MLGKVKTSRLTGLMGLPQRWLVNIIAIQEKKQYSFYVVLLFAFFVALMRFTFELMFAYKHLYLLNATLVATLTFYLQCIFIYTVILKIFIREFEWKKSIHLVLIGVFLGIFPPLIDVFVYGPGGFDYKYVVSYKDEWNWFIFNKEADVPIGEAIVLFVTMFLVASVVYIKTRNTLLTILAFVLTYCSVFFYGGLVPLVADDLTEVMSLSARDSNGVFFSLGIIPSAPKIPLLGYFQILICISVYFLLNPGLFFHLMKRINHAIPVVITCLLGYSVYKQIDGYAIFIGAVIFFAALVVIVQNDYFDKDEDTLAGKKSCVNKDDVAFFNTMLILMMALLIFNAIFSGYMLMLFLVVSYLYNYDYYRGKKYFPSAYKLEGIAGLSAYLTGVSMVIATTYGISFDRLNLNELSLIPGMRWSMEVIWAQVWSIQNMLLAFFVFGGWSILSVIKDYKDIENDTRVGSQTAYTLILKNNKNVFKFHKMYVSMLSLLMLIPLYWLFQIGSPILSGIILVLLSVLFLISILRSGSNKTVGTSLMIINVYLLNLVYWFHVSHG